MPHTAFPQLEQNLKRLVTRVDPDPFQKKGMPGCSTSFCGRFGMCCSLTVAVTAEEAATLQALVTNKADFFKRSGGAIHGKIYRTDPVSGRRFLRKKRRTFKNLYALILNLISENIISLRAFTGLLRVCVFSMKNGCCALQKLSEAEGRHKWYYKPVNCWKYPLSITEGRLTLADQESFSYFPCHRAGTVPVAEGLHEELEFMGKIIGRDLLEEIRGL